MSKPKKMSLISNLLNRVDEKSLAVKSINNGILIYWSTTKEKHLHANKDLLSLLSYEEISEFFEFGMQELFKPYTINTFIFETYLPNKKVEHKKEAILVKSYKSIDKIGTSKGETEIFTGKNNKK